MRSPSFKDRLFVAHARPESSAFAEYTIQLGHILNPSLICTTTIDGITTTSSLHHP
jgi:hypothetical protein